MQFKIEPFKHPLKVDPLWEGKHHARHQCAGRALHSGQHQLASCVPVHASSSRLFVFWIANILLSDVHLLDAEKTWKVLEDAIHEINNHNASGLSFEELYRCAAAAQPSSKHTMQCALLAAASAGASGSWRSFLQRYL